MERVLEDEFAGETVKRRFGSARNYAAVYIDDIIVFSDNLDDDTAFAVAYEWKDWPDEVASRFGNWLNGLLLTHGLPQELGADADVQRLYLGEGLSL